MPTDTTELDVRSIALHDIQDQLCSLRARVDLMAALRRQVAEDHAAASQAEQEAIANLRGWELVAKDLGVE